MTPNNPVPDQDAPAQGSEPHLWETDHPYYCTTGNYFVPGTRWHEVHNSYDSWADFYEDWGNNDPDLNLVFRWDWKRSDPDDYEPDDDGITRVPADTLQVFWVLQRKAILRSTECVVTEADEPAVLAWLRDRARTITAIWQPLTLAAPGAGDAAAREEQPADTLPAWLCHRYRRYAFPDDRRTWEQLHGDDRSFWEHEAAAVRRAVERGGFKAQAVSGEPK